MLPQLTIVVPCYNEQDVLPISTPVFVGVIRDLVEKKLVSENSRVMFVDDGSRDETWRLISEFANKHDEVKGVRLSRNRGHQVAVLAGMTEAQGDLIATIDADLQDDPAVIEQMVLKSTQDGCDIVYGVRADRSTDTVFKRNTAEQYYKLLKFLGVDIVFNHADFRLLSRRALDSLLEYRETNLFLRGIVPMIGYRSGVVEYSRSERQAGESKYPLAKMVSLAWEGVTSLSIRPLRLITALGVVISMLAFATTIFAFAAALAGASVEGWASVIIAISFFGGVQLLALGLIGEYVGKIYLEVKRRPKYFVDSRV
ncbi:glycosyltransferase family 2 protein [uncultured Maricaulis sp.]|uniref:glycosyltransferase family 2 protein n=1 Tax=uncultured Maricaulis sp. TaxID=174710 RepID=UPI002615ECF1|nr:glycosyltransferase family 2 protein [uncultured Maricaulis sp.]